MNIYFSGIGGVGIGPLAEIAYDAGYHIAGSDTSESLMTRQLRQKNINISNNQDGEFLLARHHDRPIDWFIYSSAISTSNPEFIMAKKLGIKTAKRDELLSFIINDKNLKMISVAGTHGKTTTTSMLVWALQQLNVPVSYSIGTTLKFGPSGKFDPHSEYFIYECDEFDRNFLHYTPYLSIICSIDYDHPDTYPKKSDYLAAFKQFAMNSRDVITWNDQHAEIFENMPHVDLIEPILINEKISLNGEVNRRNATLVQIALKKLGFNQDTEDIISDFPGVDRRFERLAKNLYSDYGHHPAEIAATLQLAREISSKIMLIYQPHQNIRQHQIRKDYTNQFIMAQEIYWLPTYLSREDPNLKILEPKELIENIVNKDNIHIADFNDDLWEKVNEARKKGVLVLAMGAGQIDDWLRSKLIQK